MHTTITQLYVHTNQKNVVTDIIFSFYSIVKLYMYY